MSCTSISARAISVKLANVDEPPPLPALYQASWPAPFVPSTWVLAPSAIGQLKPSRITLPSAFGVIAMLPPEALTIA